MSAARSWCFTLNNWTEDEFARLREYFTTSEWVERAIIGKEVGAEQTPHLQGYFGGKKLLKLSAVKKLNARAHWEIAEGSPLSNKIYCTKEDQSAWTKGVFPAVSQGRRSDVSLMRDLVVEGKSRLDLYNAATSYQAFRFGELGLALLGPRRTWAPEVHWFYGPTGTGKSHEAFRQAPNAFWANSVGHHGQQWWWCGYAGEADVIVDDFRSHWCSMAFLLRLLDRYPIQVQSKGGNLPFLARRIFITGPVEPGSVYGNGEDSAQLVRRVRYVREFTDRFVEPIVIADGDDGGIASPSTPQPEGCSRALSFL